MTAVGLITVNQLSSINKSTYILPFTTVVNAVVNIVGYGFGFDIGYCIDYVIDNYIGNSIWYAINYITGHDVDFANGYAMAILMALPFARL